jgi:acetyl-CoA carboxylase carboxyltransferase component
MQTLLLKTDDGVFEQIKAFLSLLPKEKVQIIDPFEVGTMSQEEETEIKALLQNEETQTLIPESKRSYTL